MKTSGASKDWSATPAREIPAYSISEAAHYLGVPRNTLRAWCLGQSYRAATGPRNFEAILSIADPETRSLSFMNLIEVHVLEALRRQHMISLQKVRRALQTLAGFERSRYPLASNDFATAGYQLFVQRYGELINLTEKGQIEMGELLAAYLRRVERDEVGIPIRLYPYTRGRDVDQPAMVVIDPLIAFGRPTLRGTGVPTAVIAERYKAGESMDELADDYEISRGLVEEAVRCELEAA